MTDQLKEFIKENRRLFDKSETETDYLKIYQSLINALETCGYEDVIIGELTEVFFRKGIYPERYLEELPPYFLYGATLHEYTIPSHITSIGEYAFCGALNLEKIQFPFNLQSVGRGAFESCYNLKALSIPSSVTKISDFAFSDCNHLKVLQLPILSHKIKTNTLNYCTDLTHIYFDGTAEEWMDKMWNKDAFQDLSKWLIIHCTDENIELNDII